MEIISNDTIVIVIAIMCLLIIGVVISWGLLITKAVVKLREDIRKKIEKITVNHEPEQVTEEEKIKKERLAHIANIREELSKAEQEMGISVTPKVTMSKRAKRQERDREREDTEF